uniref:Uncharacterized protein n=1 Tax=Arundo donax TaxID=35708 RepID=A0A0A9ADH7_ARUDO
MSIICKNLRFGSCPNGGRESHVIRLSSWTDMR